jgi:hypothetical protein
MSKKIYSVLLVITVSIFFSLSTASAYELNWNDQLGTSKTIGGFQLTNQAANSPLVADYETVTQNATGSGGVVQTGDTFTETAQLSVANPLDASNNSIAPPYLPSPFKVYLDLAGYTDVATDGTATTYYTSGSGSIVDTGASQTIMTFTLVSSTPSLYSGSIFSPVGIQANVSTAYKVTNADTSYFQTLSGPSLTDLISNGWLLALTEGNFTLKTASYDSIAHQYTYGFTTDGVRADFNAVPEPATLMLLGFGLIGLACITRKKNQSRI